MEDVFRAFRSGEPDWFTKLRKESFEKFIRFPKEEFKESPTQKNYTQDFDLLSITVDRKDPVKISYDPNQFIFSDMREAFQTHEKVIKKYFMTAIKPDEHRHAAFGYAFFNSGKFIYVPKNVHVSKPIHLVQGGSKPTVTYLMIVMEKGSSLTFIEELISQNATYSNMIVEIFLEEGSQLNYYAAQNLDKNDFGYTVRRSLGKKNSRINFVVGSFGSKTYISNTKPVMLEEGAEGYVYELFKTKDNQHMDITSDVHHKFSKTFSKLLVKGIGLNESNSVFRGMIYMDQIASQCTSNLQHYALLLDDTAKANAIPGLEIKTNDVTAKHGSAIGHIDQDHVFYLMSRGLTRVEAMKLVLDGYFEPVISNVKDEEFREKLRGFINA